MQEIQHVDKALRVERSQTLLGDHDPELCIEAAMLAGTHWANATLHRIGVLSADQDVLHTYLLTVNEFRRLSLAAPELMSALAEIEDLRPLYVRGDAPGASAAAQRAQALARTIRRLALSAGVPGA